MALANRNSTLILASILENAQETTTITKLVTDVNCPTLRLQKFLKKLTDAHLIVGMDKKWVITGEGRIFLEEYKRFYEMSQMFGLEL